MIVYSTDRYDVRFNAGREQPFTVWSKRDKRVEFFGFTRTEVDDYLANPTNVT